MMRNTAILDKFEEEQIKKNKPSYSKSLSIFQALWKEAIHLGVLPSKNSLDDMEGDIRMARILNSSHV